jgi:hypothetical protein
MTDCALTQSLKRMFPVPMTGAEIEASIIDLRTIKVPYDVQARQSDALARQKMKEARGRIELAKLCASRPKLRARYLADAAMKRKLAVDYLTCAKRDWSRHRASDWLSMFSDMVSGPQVPEGFR